MNFITKEFPIYTSIWLRSVYTYRLRQIHIVPIAMDPLTNKIGLEPILPVKRSITIGIMLTLTKTVRVSRQHGHFILGILLTL